MRRPNRAPHPFRHRGGLVSSPTRFELVDYRRIQGGLKVYSAVQGSGVAIGISVTNGAAQHAVKFYTATTAGAIYFLEHKAALQDASWMSVGGSIAGDGRPQILTDPATAGANGYYRVRVQA